MEQQIRDILDRWEVGMITHWEAMSAIRQIVGGDSTEYRTRMVARKPARGNRK